MPLIHSEVQPDISLWLMCMLCSASLALIKYKLTCFLSASHKWQTDISRRESIGISPSHMPPFTAGSQSAQTPHFSRTFLLYM